MNPNVVDLVSQQENGDIALIIAEIEAWTGSDGQLNLLAEKLKNYTGYALDGQLVKDYPQAKNKQIIVQLNHVSPLPDSIVSLLDQAYELYGAPNLRFETLQGRE